VQSLKNVRGLMDVLTQVKFVPLNRPGAVVSAAEFLLEGLHAQKKIARSEQQIYTAARQERQHRFANDWTESGGIN
jgi:magnesium chelatase subunit I